MPAKTKILEVLGEGKSDLLLMEKVSRALQANERVKYLLTLLQFAWAQAREPNPSPDDLSLERRRSGLDDVELDQVIPRASLADGTGIAIPAGDRIVSLALDETGLMCDPLTVASRPEARGLKGRLETVRELLMKRLNGKAQVQGSPEVSTTSEVPRVSGNCHPSWGISGASIVLSHDLIGLLTSAERSDKDSLHLVVMDAHKALNSLIAEIGARREKIGGADALGLMPDDRQLVQAFTEGVESTRHLKGTHPGLDTTAMRAGSRLIIQNDIGETDAHVFLVELEGDRLELTYTDIHDKRAAFFKELLQDLPISWKMMENRSSSDLEEGAFILLRGSMVVRSLSATCDALRAIGSTLVFLIDWNKTRKRLRSFIKENDVKQVLLWAARERVGFMAFLVYGGDDLLFEALEALPTGTVRFGEPLVSIMGREVANDFIKDTLRLCRESQDRRESRTYLVDRLRCLLLARAKRLGGSAEGLLFDMATLVVESALAFRDSLRAVTRPMPGLIARSAERMARWEERADERLNRIRKLGLKEPQPLLPVAAFVDDAMDSLEDAANLALALGTHFGGRPLPENLLCLLEEAAELALRSAQLLFQVLHRYRDLLRGRVGEALFDTINALKHVENQGNKLKRTFLWQFLPSPEDPKLLFLLSEINARLETVLNALSRAGFLIHDLAYAAMERTHA